MKDAALIIIDFQTALIKDKPYNIKKVTKNIQALIQFCNEKEIEIIYIRHNDGNHGDLKYGSKGWQIDKSIEPQNGEKIFDKEHNSAFKDTGLKEYLDQKNIKKLILAGMQTEYCFDTTCKVAFEFGYEIILPEDANTTFDNEYLDAKSLYEFYMYKLWNNRFGEVLHFDDLDERLAK
jgi:nicotinamidase-related amidase